MALIGVDIGTTGTRAMLFSERGEIITSSYQEYAHIYPNPGWDELDPEKVWGAVQKTIHEVCDRSKNPIKALAISCMGDTFVPVREDGVASYNGILAMDTRSTEEVMVIGNAIGEDKFFQITGIPISTMSSLSKILWLRRHKPENFHRTWKFLTFADYTLLRMGFPPKIDYSIASSTTAFDIQRKEFSNAMLKEIGLNSSMFAEPVPSGWVIGEIPSASRSQLGLPKGVKIVIGGHDFACGVLGAGVSYSTPRMVANIGGTYENVVYIRKEPTLGRQAFSSKVRCSCNVVKDTYTVCASLPGAGSVIRWFRDEFAYQERTKAERKVVDIYDLMFEPLEFNGGSILVLPYFAGSLEDSHAKGVFVGLTLATSRQEIFKGIVEAITHELKESIDRLEGLSQVSLDVIRAIGGFSKSNKWLQLKADITGKIVETVHIEEGSALGAALLAGTATGIYNSIEEAIEVTIKRGKTFWPRPKVHEIYSCQHEIYRKLAHTLLPSIV